MAHLSSNDPNGRLFPYTSTVSTSVSAVSATPPTLTPSFSNFQFKTIGRQPTLLQRISTPAPDNLPYQDLDCSPSLSPDLPNEHFHSSETLNSGQPSLQARLSVLEPYNDEANGMNVDLPNAKEIDMPSRLSAPPNGMPTASSQHLKPTLGENIDRPRSTISNVSEKHQADGPPSPVPFVSSQTETDSSIAVSHNTVAPAPSEPTLLSPSPSSNIAPSPNTASLTYEPSLATLRELQMRISSVVSNIKPISITDALQVAQSAKDQCTEVNSSARHVHELAQQALTSAQLSMDAARQCLVVAGSIQMRADEVMSAVESIASAQGTKEWNDALEALKVDSHLLDQWVHDKEAQEAKRQLELKDAAERRNQEEASQLHGAHSNSTLPSRSSPSITHRSNSLQSSAIDNTESNSSLLRVEDDPATRAWEQECKEREKRKRQAEAEFRKLREAEEVLEQNRKKAQAELDARAAELAQRRAERIEAEEQEKARQEQEAKEAEIKHREVKRVQEEAARRASELRALEAAEKDAQVQKEKEERLRAEQEQKRIEKEESDALEQQRLVQLKRQEISDQKQRASYEEAKRIQEERRAAKLGQAQAEKILTPPTAAAPLPMTSPPQAIYDCGNIVSKKTLLAGSPGKKQTAVSDRFRASTALSDPFAISPSSTPIIATTPRSTVAPTSTPVLGLDDGPQVFKDSSSVMSSSSHYKERAVTPVGTGQASIHESQIKQVPHPLPLPRRQNGSVGPSQTAGNKSLPASENLPETSSTLPVPRANNIAADVSVDSQGSDIGNLPLLPRSLVPPISPEAQKANLRRLMDANGIPQRPPVKQNTDEGKPLVKLEQQPEGPVSCYPVSKFASGDQNGAKPAIKRGPPRKQLKTESPEDIPLLSLPSPTDKEKTLAQPPASTTDSSKRQLPTFKRKNPAAIAEPDIPSQPSNVLPVSTNDSLPRALPIARPGEPSVADGASNILPTSMLLRHELPSGATSSQLAIPAMNSCIGSDGDSRMGPNLAINDGCYQPSPIQDMPDHRQRLGVRAPRPMIDHYSPPSLPPPSLPPPSLPPPTSAISRGPPQRSRPRMVDHYSPPRRTPEPLPASTSYDGYPRKASAQYRGSTSANNSRGSSPDRALRNDRSLSSESVPFNGRKRLRDDQDVGSPPRRRSKYENWPSPHESGPHNPGSHRPGTNPYQDEWSHTAEYGRSPSPELLRPTSLSQRIEPEPDTRPPFYRVGQGSGQRYDQQNQRRQASYSQPLAQGSDHPHQNSNPSRQYYRNHDSRPQLLNRFSDSVNMPVPPSDIGYFPPNRGPRPRAPKPNLRAAQPPLEHRIASKDSLINRLEGMQN